MSVHNSGDGDQRNSDVNSEIIAAIRNVQTSRNARLENELNQCRQRLDETRNQGRQMAAEIENLRARLAEGQPAIMQPMVTFERDGSADGGYATIRPRN